MIFKELNEQTYFMETVFRNRGFDFHQFADIEEAKTWLAKIIKNEGDKPSFFISIHLCAPNLASPQFDAGDPPHAPASAASMCCMCIFQMPN